MSLRNLFKTTHQHKRYWAERKIDWNQAYLQTWNHPHRFLISRVLQTFNWLSLIEIGCGSGPNLVNIVKTLGGKNLGGVDVNADAIELARKTFKDGLFQVGSGDNMMLSDKSTDVVLSDACLIYVDPFQIRRYLKEVKRVTRNHVVLCEFHSKSFFQRLKLRIGSGYNAYDYKKLLEKEGFYDITIFKIPKEAWPGTPWEEFGHIITAKVPKR